jgi:hypothetical protein
MSTSRLATSAVSIAINTSEALSCGTANSWDVNRAASPAASIGAARFRAGAGAQMRNFRNALLIEHETMGIYRMQRIKYSS